jgi:hypothetical protein
MTAPFVLEGTMNGPMEERLSVRSQMALLNEAAIALQDDCLGFNAPVFPCWSRVRSFAHHVEPSNVTSELRAYSTAR